VKACGVYFRGDAVFVISSAKTVPGFLIDSQPMFKLGRGEPPAVWGEAVLRALDSFREGVPMETAPRTAGREFLDFTGFKSWSTFAGKALHLSIAYDGKEVMVIPTVRSHGGFNHLPEQAVRCPPHPPAVGEALLEALGHCS
jgi:hypothetical protein